MNTVTIASYNVQIPAVKTEDHNWNDRKHHLLPNLPRLGDIIGLQEVSYSHQWQGEEIADELAATGFTSYEPVKHSSPFADEFHERVPIFWKKDVFQAVDFGQIMLTAGTAEQQERFPNIENRYCTFVQLQDKSEPSRIYNLFNLHQQHVVPSDMKSIAFYQETQWEGLRNLESFIRESSQKGAYTIVMGDFNSNHPDIEELHCAKEAAMLTINGSYNSYHGYNNPFPAEGENIDHILTNITGEHILSYETCVNYEGSDHHPIRMTVTF